MNIKLKSKLIKTLDKLIFDIEDSISEIDKSQFDSSGDNWNGIFANMYIVN